MTLSVDTSETKASTLYKQEVGERLKAARAKLGLSQEDMAAQSGVSYSVYQKYEIGKSAPGAEAVAGLIQVGISANWLLAGEGTILLADLHKMYTPPAINVDALVRAVCVSLQTAPKGETQQQSVRKAIEFYQFCMDRGLITPEGEGPGTLPEVS